MYWVSRTAYNYYRRIYPPINNLLRLNITKKKKNVPLLTSIRQQTDSLVYYNGFYYKIFQRNLYQAGQLQTKSHGQFFKM